MILEKQWKEGKFLNGKKKRSQRKAMIIGMEQKNEYYQKKKYFLYLCKFDSSGAHDFR